MHHNNFNWYSTNSYKRYQQKHPRLDQFSDEGRVPLGHPDDPENIKMQELVIASATPEEVEQWKAFAKQQREGSMLAKRRLGLMYEDLGDKYRSFPVKEHEWNQSASLDYQGGSDDTSQTKRNEYRSRFVLNRKVNTRPPSASTPPSHLVPTTSAQNDEIFIDDSNPSARTNMRMVVSGDKIKAVLEKQASPTREHPRITVTKSPLKPVQEQENVTVEKSVSPPVAPSTSSSANHVQECILFKKGHCFDPKGCTYLHVGTGGGDVALKPKPIIWAQKTPSTDICPGYTNFSCWDTKCKLRHVAYLSDPL